MRRANAYRTTLCIGRSPGIHAEPVTSGWKLAGSAFELDRARLRLVRAFKQYASGSSPVRSEPTWWSSRKSSE